MQKYFLILATLALPLQSFAAGISAPHDFKGLVALFIGILGQLILLIFALTIVAIVWGVVKGWIIQGGSSEGVENGKNFAIVGIIALVVMVSVWGIVSILKSSLF